MADKIIWIDVGTHLGQEYLSVFSSRYWFLAKLLKGLFSRYFLRRESGLGIFDAFAIFKTKKHLGLNRDRFHVVFVEANPIVFSNRVYEGADSAFCIALGETASNDLEIAPLYFANNDEKGQGSSLFRTKHNISTLHSRSALVVSPEKFAEELEAAVCSQFEDYRMILRINCEGSEDDVIYSLKKVFGRRFSNVLGSLKDVEDVKGVAAHEKLIEFMERENIDCIPFSSNFSTWLDAHRKLASILEGLGDSARRE